MRAKTPAPSATRPPLPPTRPQLPRPHVDTQVRRNSAIDGEDSWWLLMWKNSAGSKTSIGMTWQPRFACNPSKKWWTFTKVGTLQTECQKSGLQIFVVSKSGHYNFCSLKKPTLCAFVVPKSRHYYLSMERDGEADFDLTTEFLCNSWFGCHTSQFDFLSKKHIPDRHLPSMCWTLDRCVILHDVCRVSFLCVCVDSCLSWDPTCVPLEWLSHWLPHLCIPDLNRLVAQARDYAPAVKWECDRINISCVSLEWLSHWLPRLCIPDRNCPVVWACDNMPAVRWECDRINITCVFLEWLSHWLPHLCIPDPNCLVVQAWD